MGMILTTLLIILLANLALGVILWLRVRKLYSYPGLFGFPIIGNLYYFYKTLSLCSLDSLLKHIERVTEEYGKSGICFHNLYGFRLTALITDPALVKKLAFHPNLADKPYTMYAGFHEFFTGPFSALRTDDVWKQRRKEYNNTLKKTYIENDYILSYIKCADKLVESMTATPSSVNAHAIALALTQDVTLRTLFGIETNIIYRPEMMKVMTKMIEFGSILGANSNIIRAMSPIIQPIVNKVVIGKGKKLRKVFFKGTSNPTESDQYPPPEKPLAKVIAARNRKSDGNGKQLPNELQELFFTSAHTVAATLGSTIILFSLFPEIQERALQEQNEIFGNDMRDPNMDDVKQMQFLERFIKECLRVLGPPFVAKMASADIDADGITIPNGTVVVYMLRQIRMDPKNWKNPEVFDPDRFLEDYEALNHIYAPFGVGIRSCPGQYFATTLMKIVLSKIVRKLKVRPVQDFTFEDIEYFSSLLVEVGNQPQLKIEERT